MRNILPLYCLASAVLFLLPAAIAQQSAPAPVPSSILAAQKIFISNAGADSGLFPHPFSGDPDRAYQQFFTAVQGWHRYQLVADPAQADLVLELRLNAPNGPQSPDKATGASDPLPMFRLVIYDRPTHYILWALTESIAPAERQKNHDLNFDQALGALEGDFRTISRLGKASPATAAPQGKTRFGQQN